MVSQVTLALLGLASTAAATFNPLQLKSLNGLRAERVVVEVRQVSSSQGTPTFSELPTLTPNAECESALEPLGADVPTPAPALFDYMESFMSTADISDPTVLCDAASQVPQSLSSQYSEFDQAASTWLSKHSSELEVAATKCSSDDASVNQAVESIKYFLNDGCGAASTTATPGLAARPTGMVAGAVAAAGALGVAALL
ncbi:hypothetical protein K445DRAFT_319343 [Daldinia sp. EC12]|nr:hypothetical protein K445DRAFT_319343 [Daldinia sp. EC12]